MTTSYRAFLSTKVPAAKPAGIDVPLAAISESLFPFQRAIARWALYLGRAAILAGCGLGKTRMQLEWGRHVAEHTGRPVLILAPLAVGAQTAREGAAMGLTVTICRSQADVRPGLNVANYERLSAFDPAAFGGVVLDESSILKSFTGKTKQALIESFADTPFRLACTATPAPNDHLELGNHAEFLGVMPSNEMIMRWFVADSMQAGNYRLKGHAELDFWRWVASWAVCLEKPSDIGFDDAGYELPPLDIRTHFVDVDVTAGRGDSLFRDGALTATSLHDEMRRTAPARAGYVGGLVKADPDEPWLVWCNTNYEADELVAALGERPHVLEVRGEHTADSKENAAKWFTEEASACGSPSTPSDAASAQPTTRSIARSGTGKGQGSETAPSGASTCASTSTDQTSRPGSQPSDSRKRRNGTSGEESSTRPTPNCGSGFVEALASGNGGTLSAGSPNGSNGSESHRTTTDESSPIKAAAAPSAVESGAPTNQSNPAASTSITATQPVAFAVCSVQTATPESASSKTIPNGLSEPPSTSGGRILVSKPSIFGYGLNFQHCARIAFVGLSYSFEDLYQAIRRCWRFGQTRPVIVHIVCATTEGDVLSAIRRKEADHARMQRGMIEAMREGWDAAAKHRERALRLTTERTTARGEGWTMHLDDCCEGIKQMPDASVGLTVFSPPFANLYIYSDSVADMGNCADEREFFDHFAYLVPELLRVTIPGRLCCVHCKDLPAYHNRDGRAGLKDFPGDLIRVFEEAGWSFHSRVTIWKCPVTERERTNNNGLLHKTICRDSSQVRQGMADYVLVFRRTPDASLVSDAPIERPNGLQEYRGTSDPRHSSFHPSPFARTEIPDAERAPIAVWRRYAEPVWWDIDQTDVLNFEIARAGKDERHICPLQLGVIQRCVELWSLPGDLVFSPFAGVGSEGYQALLMGRRFEGIELKPAYFEVARKHLAKAVREAASAKRSLFAEPDEPAAPAPAPARKRKATAVAEGGAA